MQTTFSIYEAKARFSEIVRMVREDNQTITLTYRGEPVAEIRPIVRTQGSFARKLQQLEMDGALTRAALAGNYTPLATRPGALTRLLDERE